jgi:hypothetical protein
MSDKQDSMITDVRQIKDAIYNPEQGLYARIRDLEQWQTGLSRTIWLISSSLVALLVKTVYDLL